MSQNMMNRCKWRHAKSSIFKGVSFSKQACNHLKPWRMRVTVNGHIFCSFHATEKEAARAYDIKARELVGDYLLPNFAAPACTGGDGMCIEAPLDEPI